MRFAKLLSICGMIVMTIALVNGFTSGNLVWVALMVVLGFLTASVYVFFALQASNGDWQRFWMGWRADG
ncbi:MAG: hypothetical protein P8Z41_17560 [Anaerolineales bacterium]